MSETPALANGTARIARCDCGALSLTVTADPVHVHACTCTKCQRSSGSALLWSAWFPESGVLIEGPYTIFHRSNPPDPRLMTGFCPSCGTGKFFRSGNYLGDCIGISAGSFADPTFLTPDHIHWWPDRPTWLAAPHGPTMLQGND